MIPFFMFSVPFSKQEVRVDNLEADVVLNIPHDNTLSLLLFANHGLSFRIFYQLCNGIRQNLTLLHDWNGFDSERGEDFLDFRRRTFVVGINQVECEKVVPTDVVLVSLDTVAANLTL